MRRQAELQARKFDDIHVGHILLPLGGLPEGTATRGPAARILRQPGCGNRSRAAD